MRMCFALDLKNDPSLIAQYKKWHAPGGPPQAVNDSIRNAGIESLQIYLCGNRLFMIMDTLPHFSLAAKAEADAANPDVAAWETLMWTFQQALPWARPGEKWVLAEPIYDLQQQP